MIAALSSCTSNPSGIGINAPDCCAVTSEQSFHVTAKNIPAFLGPLMVSNFSVAMAAKGFQPVSEGGELAVELEYVQTNLIQETVKDDFGEPLAPGGDVRFIAKITARIHDSNSGKILWSGSIQRTHTVSPGEYMHTGRASIALLDAFNELLADLPGKSE